MSTETNNRNIVLALGIALWVAGMSAGVWYLSFDLLERPDKSVLHMAAWVAFAGGMIVLGSIMTTLTSSRAGNRVVAFIGVAAAGFLILMAPVDVLKVAGVILAAGLVAVQLWRWAPRRALD